ncbi:MAG: ATP-binding protein [Anaeromyxobacteraceae bacterium]
MHEARGPAQALFDGPGEARDAARRVSWATTPLGAVEHWPAALRSAVQLCLDCRTPMAIWAGPEFALIYNDGYAPVLGPGKHPAAMGRAIREVWPEVLDGIIGPFREVMKNGAAQRFEEVPYRIHRHGREEEAIFTYTLTPLRDGEGRIIAVFNVCEEITRTVRAARVSRSLLEEERARVQAILDTIPVGLFVTEANGKVTLTNVEAKRIWAGSVPTEDISGYDQYAGYWPSTGQRLAPEEWPAAQALLHGRRTKGVVVDIERFDGTKGTIVFCGAPTTDAAGAITGAVVAIQDISELRTAQARLEEADRRKNHFLAVLSHELRNPLAPVKNSLYILDRVPPGADQARRARAVIGRQIDQLTHLVDDLLDVTRITRGKVQLQRARLELTELVRRTFEDHRTVLEGAGLAARFEAPGAPIHIDADGKRVAQIVGNLLQNAAKFTPPGGEVDVSVAVDAEAGHAVVRVADTGVGIEPQVLARLFEPFMQADETLDRSKGGLGLGLALVKGLVDLHGGRIEARSEGQGRGAAFTVRLPLQAVLEAAPERRQEAPAARRRVLLIEDNPDAAQSLKELLELDGHEVAVAGDGPQGLERARALRPDVVLCDIGLPVMDGYAVARAFRADASLRGARLVALSGYALPDDVRRARDAGFEHHIPKPATRERLAAVLGAG